jgi:hypothetical protein
MSEGGYVPPKAEDIVIEQVVERPEQRGDKWWDIRVETDFGPVDVTVDCDDTCEAASRRVKSVVLAALEAARYKPPVRTLTLAAGPCDDCDPSFGCFDGGAPCSKRPAR